MPFGSILWLALPMLLGFAVLIAWDTTGLPLEPLEYVGMGFLSFLLWLCIEPLVMKADIYADSSSGWVVGAWWLLPPAAITALAGSVIHLAHPSFREWMSSIGAFATAIIVLLVVGIAKQSRLRSEPEHDSEAPDGGRS